MMFPISLKDIPHFSGAAGEQLPPTTAIQTITQHVVGLADLELQWFLLHRFLLK